jgi:hypothetical protein
MADQRTRTMSADYRADFEECRVYWMERYPVLNEKTRSIITLTFSMLVQAFLSRPLRALFCADTTVRPEDAFDGKIIVVDLPVQNFRLAGRVAALAWKYCFQVSVMRRIPPPEGYLRPVFLWGDEAQNFISDHDSVYQAVARSGGGATVYLTQNRESYRRVLGNSDAVDSLLHNLQCKIFCQNTGETNEWAAKLMGERWLDIKSSNIGRSGTEGQSHSAGVNIAEQKRHFIEPSTFTTLLRGGPINQYQVECIVFNGGYQFLTQTPQGEFLFPYKRLTFDQRDIYG